MMTRAQIMNEHMMAKTECYCNPIPCNGVCTYCLHQEIKTLEAQNEILKETLSIYGNIDNWSDFSKVGAYLFFKYLLPSDFFDPNRESSDPEGWTLASYALKQCEKLEGMNGKND